MKMTKTKTMQVTKIDGPANCDVLGDGSRESDHAHVSRTTPFETKARQMKTAQELGIDPQREKSTSRKRANKETKPF